MITDFKKGKKIVKEKIRKAVRHFSYGGTINTIHKYYKLGYENIYTSSEVDILKKKPRKMTILAQLNEIVVLGDLYCNKKYIYLCPDINVNVVKYKIELNIKNFPGLIDGSNIQNVLLLKYIRRVSPYRMVKDWRMIIITDKCQIYHNKPSRFPNYDGLSLKLDFLIFDESVVWDLEGRKFPSKNEKCHLYEKYYPGLNDTNYNLHPLSNDDTLFVDLFGNKGFPSYIKTDKGFLSRFYFPKRSPECNPFSFMSGFENDYKMTVLGSYQDAKESPLRCCIFMSNDGGRQWFAKYEFGDSGSYDFLQSCGFTVNNGGNPICYLGTNKKPSNLVVCKRTVEFDTRPFFQWHRVGKVENIIRNQDRLIFVCEEKHSFKNNEVIAFFGDSFWFSNNSDNNTIDYCFKAYIIDDYSFYIREFVSNVNNPYCCRHIHSINRNSNGWIVGTGEIYPNGWILQIYDIESDYFLFGYELARKEFPFIILNNSINAAQRIMGAIELLDDNLLIASDHSLLHNRSIEYDGNDYWNSSNGVYAGSIKDINDFKRFKCVYKTCEVCYFFKEINGIICFCGQLGEFSFSKDKGITWVKTSLDTSLVHLNGRFKNGFVIDEVVFIFK